MAFTWTEIANKFRNDAFGFQAFNAINNDLHYLKEQTELRFRLDQTGQTMLAPSTWTFVDGTVWVFQNTTSNNRSFSWTSVLNGAEPEWRIHNSLGALVAQWQLSAKTLNLAGNVSSDTGPTLQQHLTRKDYVDVRKVYTEHTKEIVTAAGVSSTDYYTPPLAASNLKLTTARAYYKSGSPTLPTVVQIYFNDLIDTNFNVSLSNSAPTNTIASSSGPPTPRAIASTDRISMAIGSDGGHRQLIATLIFEQTLS